MNSGLKLMFACVLYTALAALPLVGPFFLMFYFFMRMRWVGCVGGAHRRGFISQMFYILVFPFSFILFTRTGWEIASANHAAHSFLVDTYIQFQSVYEFIYANAAGYVVAVANLFSMAFGGQGAYTDDLLSFMTPKVGIRMSEGFSVVVYLLTFWPVLAHADHVIVSGIVDRQRENEKYAKAVAMEHERIFQAAVSERVRLLREQRFSNTDPTSYAYANTDSTMSSRSSTAGRRLPSSSGLSANRPRRSDATD